MRLAIAIVALCAFCLGTAQAEQWSPPDRSFAVEIPSGWRVREPDPYAILKVSVHDDLLDGFCAVTRTLHESIGLTQSDANSLVAEWRAADLADGYPAGEINMLSSRNEAMSGVQVASADYEVNRPTRHVRLVTRRFIVARYYAAFKYNVTCAGSAPIDQPTIDAMNAFVASLRITQIEASP